MRDEWTRVALGDVIEQVRRPVNVELDRTYVELGTRMHFGGLFEKEPITGEALGKKRVFWLQEGDLVLNIIFAVGGAIAVAGPEANGRIASHRFPTFRPRDNLCDVRFLRLFFETAEGKQLLLVNSPGSAGANRTLSTRALLRSPIPAPPIDEQRRIVDLISSLDATISATHQAVAKAEQARRAVLADLLAPPRAAAELRMADGLPTSSTPEGWTSGSLDDLGDYLNGRAFKPGDFTPTGLPVIRIKQFLDPLAEMDYFDGEGREEHLAEDGDIIFSWSGTLAVGIWNRGPAWVNQHLFKVEPKAGVDRQWLPLAIEHRIPELKKRTHGSTMRHITRAELRAVRTGIPPLDEQRRIVQIVSTLDDEIAALTATAVAARAARAAILSELLSGEHQIPPSYDRLLEAA